MLIRQAYEEDSERRQLALPLAVYHLDDAVIPLHWHRELEFWLAGDSGTLEVEGKALAYQPGDLLFVNQQMLHRTPTAIRAVDILVFDLRILLSPLLSQSESLFLTRLETGALLLPSRIGPDSPLHAPLASRLTECVRLVGERQEGWEWPLQQRLIEMLQFLWQGDALLPAGVAAPGTQYDAVKASILWMRRNFDQPLSIPALAAHAALSPSHYLRVFHRYTGQTPLAFLTDIRLEEAALLLRQGGTVTDTALRVGIPHVSHFIRQFRLRYGQTPKQYQLRHSTRPTT